MNSTLTAAEVSGIPINGLRGGFRKTWTVAPEAGGSSDVSFAFGDTRQAVIPHTVFTVSGFLRSNVDAGRPHENRLIAKFFDPAGGEVSITTTAQYKYAANEWQHQAMTFRVPDGAASVSVYHLLSWAVGGALTRGATIDMAAPQVTLLPFTSPFLDGTLPGCHWLGLPEYSPSVGYPVWPSQSTDLA